MLDLTKLKVCIIGSRGQMGSLFKQCWSGKVGDICSLDRKPGAETLEPADMAQIVPHADVLLISVPLSRFESVITAVAPYLSSNTILSDVSSVKTIPMELMQKHHTGPVVGTHPLFGPLSFRPAAPGLPAPAEDNRAEQFLKAEFHGLGSQVALTPAPNCPPHALETICALFRLAGCNTFTASAAEHDRAIAVIQSLNFLSNLAYFAVASEIPDLEKYITPSFARRLLSGRSMLQEDAGLFTNIARHTPDLQRTVQSYVRILEKAGRLDDETLNTLLQQIGRYFKPL